MVDPNPFSARWRFAILGGLFVVSAGSAARLLHPFSSGSVGTDAVTPVIEFQRLLAGRRVEGTLTETSKPLLDVIYGIVHGIFGDWRPVVWTAILAFALCVVLATILAERIGGPASGAFAAVGFTLSPILLVDLSLAYAVTWMLLGLLIAGLAATAARPRYAIAGLALAAAALARPEALAVVATGALVLVAMEIRARVKDRPRPPNGAYLVLLGLLAIPVLMGHDAVLFGDPLFWSKTAVINSEGRHVRGLLGVTHWLVFHFLGQAALLPLAAAAAYVMISRQRWQLGVGLAGVILGISTLLVVSGARGTFLATRYLEPIDLGLLFAAAIGASVLDAPSIRRWVGPSIRPHLRRLVLPILGGLLVALAVAPLWPLDLSARTEARTQLLLHANARRAMAAIRPVLGNVPSWRDLPPSQKIVQHPMLIVPRTLRAQAVVDLGLPLNEVGAAYGTWLASPGWKPQSGMIIYHDRLKETPDKPGYARLEISQPTIIDGFRYVPILVDKAAGIWVLRVEDGTMP